MLEYATAVWNPYRVKEEEEEEEEILFC